MFHISYRIPLILLFVLLLNSLTVAQPSGWSGYQSPNTAQPTASSLVVGQPQGDGKTDFLLLNTGFLMEGVVTNDSRHYTVKTEFGSIQIPVANVEFLGASRQDVYQFRRNLVDGNNCQELIKFAEWCSNNALISEAIEEYVRARQIAPNSALDSSILRRIEFLQQQAESSKDRNPFAAPEVSFSALGSSDSGGEDFNRLVNVMPKSIADAFQKKVQPILTPRCSASDCHGSASDNGFKIGIPRQPNGVTMYQNLHASLRWVDPANPSASPLLTAMITPHGGNTKPLFNVESNQYIEMIEWIQTTIKDLPAEYTDRLYATRRPQTPNVPLSRPPEVPVTFFTEENQATTNHPPPRLDGIFPPHPPIQEQSITRVAATTDPLDPALFNARFHGR